MTLRRAEQSVVQRRPREREKKKKTREIRGKFNEAKKRIQGKEENNLKKKKLINHRHQQKNPR